MYNFFFAVFLLFTLLLDINVEARWMKKEDAPIEYKFINRTVDIKADGTYDVILEIKAKILKESGRQKFTQYQIIYNSDASDLKILDAKTIFNELEYKLTDNMIENKAIASSAQGFDQINRITLSFPKIEIGSEVYLRYKYTQKKVPIKNFYGEFYSFSEDGFINSYNIQISSLLPLNIKKNDPKNLVHIYKIKNKNILNINIKLKKPIYENLINEPDNSKLDILKCTWVSVSSLTKWKDLIKQFSYKYFEVLNEKLPSFFEEIRKTSEKINNDIDKINFITSKLNQKIQYMGDWRTVNGMFFPRTLKTIAATQKGDCKDFTVSAGAILQTLGYKVTPVFVMRGVYDFSNTNALPFVGNFNHVILKITNKNKRIFWIDPTNLVSMAQGIFPDISDKIVFPLDNKGKKYIKTPKINYQNSQIITKTFLSINGSIINQSGDLFLKKESALMLSGLGMFYAKTTVKDIIFKMISGTNLNIEDKKKLYVPDLTSRTVKDLKIQFAFLQKNKMFNTNLGYGTTLGSNNWINNITNVIQDQESDLTLGFPKTIKKYTVFKNIVIKNCQKLNINLQSRWFDIKRICIQLKNNTKFIDTIQIKTSLIPNKDLKTLEFKKLKAILESDFKNASVIIN